MNNKYKSLSSQICELLQLDPTKDCDQFDAVFVSCIEHVSLKTKIKDFHNKLSSIVDFKPLDITPSKFRLTISKSGYILLNLRFYSVYLALKRGTLSDEDFDYYMMQYEIDDHDAGILTYVMEERVNKSVLRRTLRKGIKVDRSEFAPERVDEIIEDFTVMLPEIKAHINRTINKFLRFVKKSFNITHDEFMSELLFSGIKAHYYSHPNNNDVERQLGKIRASIHNYAVNEIGKYTTTKRERLVNEGNDADGNAVFSLKVMSENQMSLASLKDSDVEVAYDSMFSQSLRLQLESDQEIKFCIRQITDKYGLRSQQTKLARAFLSKDCFMFGAWLRKKKIMRSSVKTTSEFLQERSMEDQLVLLGKYLKVSPTFLQTRALPSMAKALGVI